MPTQIYPRFTQTSTADGTTTGLFTCSDNSGFQVSAFAFLRGLNGTPGSQLVRITQLISTNQVGLVFVPSGIDDPKWRNGQIPYPDYGNTNIATYLAGSVLFQYEQVLRPDGLP